VQASDETESLVPLGSVPVVEGKTKQFWEKERRKTPFFLCSAAWRGRKIFGPKSDGVTREWRRTA
jgi:hypothetical protein